MNTELQEILFSKFPDFFQRRKLGIAESVMSFGICCGDGWFQLLYELCEKLTNHDPECQALQVKEKWGVLNVYFNSTQDLHAMWDMEMEAENRSAQTCELCGESGQLSRSGYMSTRCERHQGGISEEDEASTVEKFKAWVASHEQNLPG
jgi:hypothetical protein